ncbi:MAG TPA: DUF6206 family protein [Bacteroidales bacterium]|jgi:hypothetical protein|nr:DUF6206 family protein [Bacteroidales bacterium]HOX73297.1 DUF6206 family protein [Bacteroidales bacterium]HPM88213.1 DUF6206 family protein [Bacteroidales bacterium]HQM69613.1 DUF6206 family protein [Bacteroidales bacterium]
MPLFTKDEIDAIISGLESKEKVSDLGYFSRPFRIYRGEEAFFIKLYLPVKNERLVTYIINNHDEYIKKLKTAGIRIPETSIISRHTGNNHQIIIIQDSFRDGELLRNCIIKADQEELKDLLTKVFSEIVQFLNRKDRETDIGFHPTLRNYALHKGDLWYFDTFPPMLMKQRDLNRLILRMSPHGGLLKKIIPLRFINKVTDEYYNLDKMFIGIVGSCCRLRPDDADKILTFSREYVNHSDLLSAEDKESILQLLKKPPRLSKIWILIRKLSGNTGRPNINTPISA